MSICYSCGEKVTTGLNQKIDFRETCTKCSKDLHCCLACEFYDPMAYNECHENQAETVRDKARFNRCEYFKLSGKRQKTANTSGKSKLDDLFK